MLIQGDCDILHMYILIPRATNKNILSRATNKNIYNIIFKKYQREMKMKFKSPSNSQEGKKR